MRSRKPSISEWASQSVIYSPLRSMKCNQITLIMSFLPILTQSPKPAMGTAALPLPAASTGRAEPQRWAAPYPNPSMSSMMRDYQTSPGKQKTWLNPHQSQGREDITTKLQRVNLAPDEVWQPAVVVPLEVVLFPVLSVQSHWRKTGRAAGWDRLDRPILLSSGRDTKFQSDTWSTCPSLNERRF